MKKTVLSLFLGAILITGSGFGPVENNSLIQTELKAQNVVDLNNVKPNEKEQSEVQAVAKPSTETESPKSRSISETVGEWLIGVLSVAVKVCVEFFFNLMS